MSLAGSCSGCEGKKDGAKKEASHIAGSCGCTGGAKKDGGSKEASIASSECPVCLPCDEGDCGMLACGCTGDAKKDGGKKEASSLV
ncbi:MAG: hypothetical protein AAGK14_13555 [Verrucomicrobiota bacterium]